MLGLRRVNLELITVVIKLTTGMLKILRGYMGTGELPKLIKMCQNQKGVI
jgi:hypothetical protein